MVQTNKKFRNRGIFSKTKEKKVIFAHTFYLWRKNIKNQNSGFQTFYMLWLRKWKKIATLVSIPQTGMELQYTKVKDFLGCRFRKWYLIFTKVTLMVLHNEYYCWEETITYFNSVRDGEFRQYSSSRTMTDFKDFITKQKWRTIQPMSSWLGPDSVTWVKI